MESPPLPTVSVVLATFNRVELLSDVIGPLVEDDASQEVIVVVDGCRDGSMELLEDMARTDRRLRPLFTEGVGQTAALQAGVDAATSDVVLLLDDDVIAGRGLVTGHARRQQALGPGYVVVGSMPIRQGPRDSNSFSSVLYGRAYERTTSLYVEDPEAILHSLWMGNVSVWRNDCAAVGTHSPAYGGGWHADRDFGLRCLKAGLRGVYDPSLRAQHVYRKTLEGFLRQERNRGAGVWRLHRLHEDVLGPFDPTAFSTGLPLPARAIVGAAERELVRRPVASVLASWIRCAGLLRLTSLQIPAAQLLRRIELQRGAREAAQHTPAG